MNRFHNKYHRHNHHTDPTAGEPDSAHDPIASPEDPFKGEFHIDGKLSAVDASFSTLTVHSKAEFHGDVTIASPVTWQLEHLTIVPESTTKDFYFKIDSNFDSFPLTEIYLKGSPAFVINSAANVGIGTATPAVKLDVMGDFRCFNLSAANAVLTGSLAVSGDVHVAGNMAVSGWGTFSAITAASTSQIGYLEIGFVKDTNTYLKTVSGNKDLYFYTGSTLNLKMHPTDLTVFPVGGDKFTTNYFPGFVGIGMEPKEKVTVKGQQSFRSKGFVLLDNEYTNTFRIITNRETPAGAPNDDNQHFFCFTDEGRFTVGDQNFDYLYPCAKRAFESRTSVVDHNSSGKLLSLTNITTAGSAFGPMLEFYRGNGDFFFFTPISAKQMLGSIRAYGYNMTNCWGDRNAAISFYAANDYTNQFQGSYTIFETTSATDVNNIAQERVKIDHNGNVGINTISAVTLFPYRNPSAPDWKFTVFDYETSVRPAAVIFAGTKAPVMAQIIGGEAISEQVALRLSDRGVADAEVNHIEFTHDTTDRSVVKISSRNSGANAVNGGSFLISTTYDTATPVLPFERAIVTPQGDMGVGATVPNSRLHIHDDNKTVAKASGTTRDVVTVSTKNNTNGILLSSIDLKSRIYNNNTDLDLHISTCTDKSSIKFDVSNEALAVTMISSGNVGIGIDESLDSLTAYTNTTIKLGVNGNTMLFNTKTSTTDTIGEGARLYFNREVSDYNTDPLFIARQNTATNVTELRVNIGNEICSGGWNNQDLFAIGNYQGAAWTKWLDVGACSTIVHNKLSAMDDAVIDGNLTVKKGLSVLNPNNDPIKFRGDLWVDGNIYATANITAFETAAPPAPGWPWPGPHPSDERLKLNISSIPDSLEKIMQINGVYFDWNEELQSKHKGHDVGVVAQQIEKILPEIVHEGSNGYKHVQYEKIIPLLIECIKDLKKEIDELKSK